VTATVPEVLSEDDAKRLARIGRAVVAKTRERNALIRALHAEGAGLREIARAVGLAPATVLNIITPRKR
jgi:hypothetical protein